MNCSYCGATVTDADVFCPNCGTRLKPITDTQPVGAPEDSSASATSTPPYGTDQSTRAEDEPDTTTAARSDPQSPDAAADASHPSSEDTATGDAAYGMGASTTPEPDPTAAAQENEGAAYGAPPPTPEQPNPTGAPAQDAAYGATGRGPTETDTGYVSPSPATPYGTPPAPPAAKDPTTAFIVELIAGIFGFLGIGHIYAEQTTRGVVLLVCWWAFLVVEIFLMFIIVGFCLTPLNLLVPLGSAFWLKREMEGQPIRL
ncbi:MAG: zinc-ribbon domain-containing protein [Chloroflexia bacterium]|nr:zinc-ribbon domain-containing protein [Chloroflexia bacterium]